MFTVVALGLVTYKTNGTGSQLTTVNKKRIIVLQRYYDNVYICLFVNIEIKTLRSYFQLSGVVLKTV